MAIDLAEAACYLLSIRILSERYCCAQQALGLKMTSWLSTPMT